MFLFFLLEYDFFNMLMRVIGAKTRVRKDRILFVYPSKHRENKRIRARSDCSSINHVVPSSKADVDVSSCNPITLFLFLRYLHLCKDLSIVLWGRSERRSFKVGVYDICVIGRVSWLKQPRCERISSTYNKYMSFNLPQNIILTAP